MENGDVGRIYYQLLVASSLAPFGRPASISGGDDDITTNQTWKDIFQSVIKGQSMISTARTAVGPVPRRSGFKVKEFREPDGRSPQPIGRVLLPPPNFKFVQVFPAVILAVDGTGNSPVEHPAVKVAKSPHQPVD